MERVFCISEQDLFLLPNVKGLILQVGKSDVLGKSVWSGKSEWLPASFSVSVLCPGQSSQKALMKKGGK